MYALTDLSVLFKRDVSCVLLVHDLVGRECTEEIRLGGEGPGLGGEQEEVTPVEVFTVRREQVTQLDQLNN